MAADLGQSPHNTQPVDVIIDRKGFWKPVRTLVKKGADSDMLTLRVERPYVMRVLRFVHFNGADVGARFVRPQNPVAQGTRFSSGNGTGFEHGEWINP